MLRFFIPISDLRIFFSPFFLTLQKPKSEETAQKSVPVSFNCVLELDFKSIFGLGGSIL
jgi:hypothetical protein